MIVAISAAAMVAGLAVLAPRDFGVPVVSREPPSELVANPAPPTDEGPSILLTGGACSSLEWPHYEQSCQFATRQGTAEVRVIRIIAVR